MKRFIDYTGLIWCVSLSYLFVVLKLLGVIDWAWIWVTSPIWISLIAIFVLMVLLVVFVILDKIKSKKKIKIKTNLLKQQEKE